MNNKSIFWALYIPKDGFSLIQRAALPNTGTRFSTVFPTKADAVSFKKLMTDETERRAVKIKKIILTDIK